MFLELNPRKGGDSYFLKNAENLVANVTLKVLIISKTERVANASKKKKKKNP